MDNQVFDLLDLVLLESADASLVEWRLLEQMSAALPALLLFLNVEEIQKLEVDGMLIDVAG